MAYTFVDANATGHGAASNTLALTLIAGQMLIILMGDEVASGATLTMADTLGNVYTVRGTANDTDNGGTRTLCDCLVTTGGATTLTMTGATGGGQASILCLRYTGLNAYSAASFTHVFANTPVVATDGFATTAFNSTSYPSVMVAFCFAAGTTVMAPGTGFTSRYANSAGIGGFNAGYAEDLELTSGSHIASFTPSTGASSAIIMAGTYIETPAGASLGFGHTAQSAGFTCSTGGGSNPALASTPAGTVFDVLFMAIKGVPFSCTCADNLGTVYTQIDHFDNTAVGGREFYRFVGVTPITGVPTVTCTYGNNVAEMDIVVASLTGLASKPFTLGRVVHNYQTAATVGPAPSTDSQVSTNSPSLGASPSLVGVWGYNKGQNGAPATGTGYATYNGSPVGNTAIGANAWSYETKTVPTTAPISGTFTPIALQDAYTLLAGFNLLGSVPDGAGPLPRMLLIMP